MTLTVRSSSLTGATTAARALTHAEMDANWAHVIESSNQNFTPSGSETSARDTQTKLREIERNLNDHTSAGNAISAAMTAAQALHAPAGTSDLTGFTQKTVSSDLIMLGRYDAILDASGTEEFLLSGGGNIIIAKMQFSDWANVVETAQATTPTTAFLHVADSRFNSCFNGIKHEAPLTEGLIVFNRFDSMDGGNPVKVGYNNYDLQDSWDDLRIIGNRASDLVAQSAVDQYFSQISGKNAIVALNSVDTVTGTSTGEVFGIYTKQRYSIILGNNVRGLTTGGSANPCAIQLKGSARGVTNDGVNGFANLVSSNMLLGTTARGIEIHVDDANIVGNYVEGFTLGVMPQSDADGVLTGANRIRGAAASSGNYGVHVVSSGDDQLIVGNLIDQVDRGINLAQTSERNINVVGNTIAECDGIGIQQSGTCELLSIVGNTVDGADRAVYVGGTVSRFLAVGNNWAALGDAADLSLQLDGSVTSGLVDANAPFEVTTTGNTATNIYRVTLPTNTVAWIEATVIGTEAGTHRAVYKIGGLFHNLAGTATQEGATVDLITAIESENWGGASFAPTGAIVRLQVTGLAATTINWSATVKVQLVT
jgi:hypothetical protein